MLSLEQFGSGNETPTNGMGPGNTTNVVQDWLSNKDKVNLLPPQASSGGNLRRKKKKSEEEDNKDDDTQTKQKLKEPQPQPQPQAQGAQAQAQAQVQAQTAQPSRIAKYETASAKQSTPASVHAAQPAEEKARPRTSISPRTITPWTEASTDGERLGGRSRQQNATGAGVPTGMSTSQFNSGIEPGYTGSMSTPPPLSIHNDPSTIVSAGDSKVNAGVKAGRIQAPATAGFNPGQGVYIPGSGVVTPGKQVAPRDNSGGLVGTAKTVAHAVGKAARTGYDLMDQGNRAQHPEQYNPKSSNWDIVKGGATEAGTYSALGVALFGGTAAAAGYGTEAVTAGGATAAAGEQGAERSGLLTEAASAGRYEAPSLTESYEANLARVHTGQIPGQLEMFPKAAAADSSIPIPEAWSRLGEAAPKEFARLVPEPDLLQKLANMRPGPNIEGYAPKPLPSGALGSGQFSHIFAHAA